MNSTYTKKNKLPVSYLDLSIKNQNLNDSIKYAYRIQESILPKIRHINRIWKDTIIFNKPKDIVSGDFFWITEKDGYIFWVVADCSGHGVPGAMLTMLGNSFLNYIILGKEIIETDEILNEMDKKMGEAFRYSEDSEHIDISIIRYDGGKKVINYSGARRKLIHIRQEEPTILEGDNFPIGGMHLEPKRFYSKQELKISKRDTIYIGTDGFQDQFGGPKGKKFSSKRLHKFLAEISKYELDLQKIQLRLVFNNWKGNQGQIDDVCIMGIRF